MPSTSAVTFGDLLKQLRKRNGMTQTDLAAAVGYSVPFVSNLELNQRLPDLQIVAQRFVPALGLQEEPHFATRLVELAAAARGERPPAMAAPNHKSHHRPQLETEARLATLPAPPTPLVGRDHEVRSLCNRLIGHSGRLLTLVGPPGIGKTRLGLAVAEKMQELFRDGVYFAPLAAIGDTEVVAATIANALGIAADERSSKARLIDFLRRKEALLLLDNFEQITAAASLVAELLAAAPGLYVLVTSRERLHLRAEQRYRVQPLELEPAITLFVQRAQASAADFALTVENKALVSKICQQLDCLPLAIELSAARIDIFTPATLLARLRTHRLDLLSDGPRDLPPRQRTLRSAIQDSYTLLDGGEQALFRLLGVFAGGFEVEAVVELGGDEEGLQSLINKSLVQVAPGEEGARRFLLLEMLHDYAWERLCLEGEAATIQRRHAGYFLRLAEEAATHFRSSAQGVWFKRLALEQANLRAALASSLTGEQIETAVRLGIALWRFWVTRGSYEEGAQWLQQLLACAEQPEDRAKLFYAQGMLARRRGDFAPAVAAFAASLELYRELGQLHGIASALRGLGFIYYLQDDFARARSLFEEALALFRSLDDSDGIAVTLENLAYLTNDIQEEHFFAESLALRRQTGNLQGIAMSLSGLAHLALFQADIAKARRYAQEQMQINEQLGYQNGIATSLLIMGHVAVAEADLATARLHYERSVEICQSIGDQMLLPVSLMRLARAKLLCREMEGVATLLESSILLFQEQGSSISVAWVLATFASLALVQEQPHRALYLAGAAVRHSDSLAERQLPSDVAAFERTIASARQLLSPEAADAALALGQKLTLEEAVAFALTGSG